MRTSPPIALKSLPASSVASLLNERSRSEPYNKRKLSEEPSDVQPKLAVKSLFVHAEAESLTSVRALLRESGLPESDLQEDHMDASFVSRAGDEGIFACVGLERFGETALLRSLAARVWAIKRRRRWRPSPYRRSSIASAY
jgi:hypothetical protein